MRYRLIHADVLDGLRQLADGSVQTVVTSPPYWGLRDYGVPGQIGLEETPDAFVARLVDVFREVRRVLRDDGTLWLNLGDSYAGSGRGGNPEAGTKQGTNAGSQSVGVGREQESAEAERFRIREQLVALRSCGIKPKDLVGIPWLVAFALRADGWYLRADVIWSKPNPMPESVTDRPTKAHEYLFLLTKSARYFYDAEAIAEAVSGDPEASRNRWDTKDYQAPGQKPQKRLSRSGNKARRIADGTTGDRPADHLGRGVPREGSTRNKRTVWTVATAPFPEAHFATFPPALIEPCILAGSRVGDAVLDPFNGSGTTGVVALGHQRNYVGIELNAEYVAMARRRLSSVAPMFAKEETA